ncbi:tetratricopeptide repeat protein SKI3 isoform X2 [Impatiens glandulifera]|uniref:tetratricopeptide repeat protein SKI3 isoform X2 n=1 Tax=Impatiens glandulifera TaxID=253017 RepID=UPI001FB131FC|nr:tetratricopeptide repeat protein SKI3 isoform X2 [Impatiens glandulifera]
MLRLSWKLFLCVEVTWRYPAFRTSVLSWKTVRCSAAFSACRSYKRALHLAPWEANIYMDIAIASHLAYSLMDKSEQDQNAWQLSEKMSCGSLLLEGDNHEFWVTLGCISDNTSLKQHAFIRGLQLDVSLAVSWAFLGKLYGDGDENELAKRAFDHARSIDPSLALPWASMSTHIFDSESKPIDAYENCLQAVQILPLADFQIGLAKLALTSGHLSSLKVFGAVHQAVQHAPFYPECHNISGLVYEAWSDFDSAAVAFRLARFANESFAGNVLNPHLRYISSNLARVLCKAGKALDAIQECEDLKRRGWLDTECLHIYALSLWQLGKKDLVLSVVRDLASRASSVGQASKAASISLVCRLLYYTVGLESAITYIVKMPKELFQSSKISFVVSAMHALRQSNELESVVSASRSFVTAYEDITGMHYLISLSKLIKLGYDGCLGIQSGIKHLRKLIHAYPNSTLLRNLLGYLLLLSEEWKHIPASGRCLVLSNNSSHTENEALKTAYDVLGALTVACCCTASKVEEKFSFSTCECHSQHGSRTLMQLQKWVRQEPWNNNASYLLIMNYMQKAREKRYPKHMCDLLGRLIDASLSNYQDTKLDKYCLYKRFLLLLCASEIRLQVGDHVGCINHANTASRLQLPDNYLFFAHLILCRAYAIAEDFVNLQREYTKCVELETDHQVGWICLKFIETRYNLNCGQDILQLSLEKCPKQINDTQNMWVPIHNLVRGLISVSRNDFVLAENFLSQASSVADKESCILLCHGAICLELAKELGDSQFLTIAIRSLKKAKVASSSSAQLPIVCLLLAQAEGSQGSKAKWEQNLMYEWLAWPPGKRPAELHLQMYLLSMHSDNGLRFSSHVEGQKHPQSWILSSIHLNPSCLRYWKVLQNSR